MNILNHSYTTSVKQNRVSKRRNVIGLFNAGRSISLNQLNTDYVDQFYKEQYLLLKEQHEQTKRQLNKQQDQLKQLNYRLQRLLQEKKDFLSQFLHFSQVNANHLVEDLEMTNLRLEKENRKLRDQLLLAQVRGASGTSRNQLGKVMIINMKQQLQTNYGWVKPRIDSGLNDQTKRNPLSGQLIRQRKIVSILNAANNNSNNSSRRLDIKHMVNKSTTINRSINDKSTNNRPMINKERHRVSFSNQLEQEHLYEDDFEQEEEDDEEEIMEDWTELDSSNEDSKSSELERVERKQQQQNNENSSKRLLNNKIDRIDNTIGLSSESSDNDENLKQVKTQLNKAKTKVKKLEEIVYLQQQYIDREQELANQNDHLDSLKENWFDRENLLLNDEKKEKKKNLISSSFKDINNEANLASTNLSSNSSSSSSINSSLIELDSIRTAGGSNELQIELESSNKINRQDQLVSTYYKDKNKNKKLNLKETNNGIDKLILGENLSFSGSKKTPESTKSSSSIFGDEESSSSSLSSSLDQLTLSVHFKREQEEHRILISNDDDEQTKNSNLLGKNLGKARNQLGNLRKQLQVEKARNDQIEIRNRGRFRELEQNVSELSKENEILRNSLEKCIQDCLTEIGGSGLS